MASVQNRIRVAGGGRTVFSWNGQLLAFANQVAHVSPQPVGPGATPIQPMDAPHPIEIITPTAAGMGTLTLEFLELYGAQVWERLNGLEGAIDIVDIFVKQAALATPIRVVKYIRPPKLGGQVMAPYTEEYNNCVVTNVVDGETINVGSMEVLKQITIGYTHISRENRVGITADASVPSLRDSASTTFVGGS